MKKNILVVFSLIICLGLMACSIQADEELNEGSNTENPITNDVTATKSPKPTATEKVESNNTEAQLSIDYSIEDSLSINEYFAADNGSVYLLQNSSLVKIDNNGHLFVIDNDCEWFNLSLDNNWVYFLKSTYLFRASLDGRIIEDVFDFGEMIRVMVVKDNKAYYVSEKSNLFYLDIINKTTYKLVDEACSVSYDIYKDKIYYDLNYSEGELSNYIYELDLKTSEVKTIINKKKYEWLILNNKIWVKKSNQVEIYNIDDGNMSIVAFDNKASFMSTFHQYIIYRKITNKLTEDENAVLKYYIEIRAYDTITGKDYYIWETDQDIIDICTDATSTYMLTTGIVNYKTMIDLYRIIQIDFSAGEINSEIIKEIEYYSNPDA